MQTARLHQAEHVQGYQTEFLRNRQVMHMIEPGQCLSLSGTIELHVSSMTKSLYRRLLRRWAVKAWTPQPISTLRTVRLPTMEMLPRMGTRMFSWSGTCRIISRHRSCLRHGKLPRNWASQGAWCLPDIFSFDLASAFRLKLALPRSIVPGLTVERSGEIFSTSRSIPTLMAFPWRKS